MNRFCDLHIHSTCSDGTVSPAELIRMAEGLGLGAVALCDHNTVAGLPEFLDAAAEGPVEAVAGVEFSTDYRGGELHVLALFVKPEHYGAVTDQVRQMLVWKEESNIALIAALKAAGIGLDYDAIRSGTPNGQVNRAVIAAEMVRKGYCDSVPDAFRQWLSPKRGFFKPPRRLDVFEVIRFIRSIGAVSVLAHPFLNLEEGPLREFLTEAVPLGLDAMETHYVSFSPEQTALAAGLAEEFGICQSGGSDYHGTNKPGIEMGTGRGSLRVPLEFLRELEKRRN